MLISLCVAEKSGRPFDVDPPEVIENKINDVSVLKDRRLRVGDFMETINLFHGSMV